MYREKLRHDATGYQTPRAPVGAALLPLTGRADGKADIPQALVATRTVTARDLRDVKRDQTMTRWLVVEAMRTYNSAMRAGQSGAAKNALELIGKLTGHLVERKEMRVIRSLEDLSDEELDAIVASDRSDGDEVLH